MGGGAAGGVEIMSSSPMDGGGLVSRTTSKKQQAVAGWNDISDKALSTFEADLPSSSACGLAVSTLIMMLGELGHFMSRAADGVDGLELQNTCSALRPPRRVRSPKLPARPRTNAAAPNRRGAAGVPQWSSRG